MVKIDELSKQIKGLSNYVKELRKENLTNNDHYGTGEIFGNFSRREEGPFKSDALYMECVSVASTEK
jgi:hypothetical protein